MNLKRPDRLLVISTLRGGGGERVAVTLANEWADRGLAVEIVTLDGPDSTPAFDLSPAVRLSRLGVWGATSSIWQAISSNLRRIFAVREVLKSRSPKVVISFLSRTSVTTLMANFGVRLPLIVSEHSVPDMHPTGKLWQYIQAYTYPMALAVVVPGSGVAKKFGAKVAENTVVIANPVLFSVNEHESASGNIVCTKKCQVVAVGRLEEVKGFDLLLESFSLAIKACDNLTLTIWGEGSQRSNLERKCDELGLKAVCNFPGFSEKIHEEYVPKSIFVLSSRYEAFPVALLEAMAAGMAVVSVDCPVGPSEIISNNVNGILVSDSKSSQKLADAIVALAGNPSKRGQLGEAAKACVREKYSVANIVDSWDSLVEELIENNSQ